MLTGKANLTDCLAIAELALMGGHGIPGYFWANSQHPGQTLEQAGAELATSETSNFSYRHAQLAWIDNNVAGMLMAYRLPSAADNEEDPQDFPDFVQPMVELEQCVPESFYINMVATYPHYRGRGIGTRLMADADKLALAAGCDLVSLEVFDSNPGALKLYQRLGYELIEQRGMVVSDYLPAGQVMLMTKTLVPH